MCLYKYGCSKYNYSSEFRPKNQDVINQLYMSSYDLQQLEVLILILCSHLNNAHLGQNVKQFKRENKQPGLG